MDVDLTIRYSDDRLCEIIASRPDTPEPFYRIVTRRADLGENSHLKQCRKLAASMKSILGQLEVDSDQK